MMDLRTLEAVNRRATRESQRSRKLPALIEPEDVRAYLAGDHTAIHIPYIGSRVPRGYRMVHQMERVDGSTQSYPVFVDKSGFSRESEPAWTLRRFLEHVEACDGSYWGTVEEGPFQVYVQRYERVGS